MDVFNQDGQRVGQQVNVGVGPMLSERSRQRVEAIASHFGLSADVVLTIAIDEYYRQVMPKKEDGK